MSKTYRLSEKWFRRGLWLVSIVFALFLIGLGGNIVEDLPQVEAELTLENFIDQEKVKPLRAQLSDNEIKIEAEQEVLNTTSRQLNALRDDYQNAQKTFDHWRETRQATQRPDQDAELIQRTKQLEVLQQRYADVQTTYRNQSNALEDIRTNNSKIYQQISSLENEAAELEMAAYRQMELRVFLYRLAITLPLLVIAGYLFAKKRQSQYWPFTWGFIFFALFAFFVELVPYLPSYGGYVRYIIGIILVIIIGYYAINALNRYLARQKLAEDQPETVRRKELTYDLALGRLAKSICPGCERGVALDNPENDFCPHCGISLFNHCGQCQSRKSAFSKFCHRCGTHAKVDLADTGAH